MENRNTCTFCKRPIVEGIAHDACLRKSIRDKEEAEARTVLRPQIVAPVVSFNPNQMERIGFRCPFCNSGAGYRVQSKISTGGWIGFFCAFCVFPLNFFFFLLQDKFYTCQSCGMKLG